MTWERNPNILSFSWHQVSEILSIPFLLVLSYKSTTPQKKKYKKSSKLGKNCFQIFSPDFSFIQFLLIKHIYIYIYICDPIMAKANPHSQDSHSFRSALTSFSTLDPMPEDTCFLKKIRWGLVIQTIQWWCPIRQSWCFICKLYKLLCLPPQLPLRRNEKVTKS